LQRKSQIRVTDLSRFLIYILAHRPDEFGLVPEGHIREVLIGKDRPLFVWEEDRIRAVEKRWHPDLQTPSENTPKILFVAIRRKVHVHVMDKGLFSDRPLVLSPDRDMALRIGRRRDQKPILLEVMTGPAQEEGVSFHAFGDLFLATEIPAKFISGPPVPEEIQELPPPKKEKAAPQPSIPSGGTFLLDVRRDPDLSRRRNGRKPRGWKEDSRKMRRSKG
jgi:putative RNA 2'-phosphotransferase